MGDYTPRSGIYSPLIERLSQDTALGGMGRTDKPWLNLLYLFYLTWNYNPNEPISIHNLKRDYWKEIKELGFDNKCDDYLGVQASSLYKYRMLSKVKATDGTNWNYFRINQKGLDALEYYGLISKRDKREKENFVPLSELVGHRVFQVIAPK